MWQTVVASWLMLMTGGQLELNAPQNAINQPDSVALPQWTPADDTPDQPEAENVPAEKAPVPNNFQPGKARPLPGHNAEHAPAANANQPTTRNLPPRQNPSAEANATPLTTLPKTIITRQTYFSIPARNASTSPQNEGQVVEVQMFVSHDHGAKWNFYTRVKPNQERIPFRSNGDGEFWFATRTLDRAGKFLPQKIDAPSVIVEIDTKPPIILFSAESGPSRQVTARWEISDPHLKADSLTLQYRTMPNGPWQQVALSGKDTSNTTTSQSAETTWLPTPGAKDIVIRAEVSDVAGNKGVAHAQVKIGAGGSSGGLAKDQAKSELQPVSANASPRIGNKYPTDAASDLLNNPFLTYLPPSEKARMVNSRTFELDYDLQSVGPSGVSRVELFGTRDGGRTWKSYGIDSDNRSPMVVRVEEEGLYGFQIAVTSGAGLGDAPPKSGDKASLWIGVDLTRPTAKIASAEFGSGKDDGKLVISWEASDRMLSEKPIALFYSQQLGGPWKPLVSNLENSGHYAWPIEGTMPALVYLRLQAIDEAGNRTLADLPQPIPLDRSRPMVRILRR